MIIPISGVSIPFETNLETGSRVFCVCGTEFTIANPDNLTFTVEKMKSSAQAHSIDNFFEEVCDYLQNEPTVDCKCHDIGLCPHCLTKEEDCICCELCGAPNCPNHTEPLSSFVTGDITGISIQINNRMINVNNPIGLPPHGHPLHFVARIRLPSPAVITSRWPAPGVTFEIEGDILIVTGTGNVVWGNELGACEVDWL